jgi:hypothetical protein
MKSNIGTLAEYLGMSATDYVARGLALKRAVERGEPFEGTEVGRGGLAGSGGPTSPTSLPTQKSKREFYGRSLPELIEEASR